MSYSRAKLAAEMFLKLPIDKQGIDNCLLLFSWLDGSLSELVMVNGFSPDICGDCLSTFGEVLGGRVKEICHVCHPNPQHRRYPLSYHFYYLAIHLGGFPENYETIFARALLNGRNFHSSESETPEPQQQRQSAQLSTLLSDL